MGLLRDACRDADNRGYREPLRLRLVPITHYVALGRPSVVFWEGTWVAYAWFEHAPGYCLN
jgi:hypothetical protein